MLRVGAKIFAITLTLLFLGCGLFGPKGQPLEELTTSSGARPVYTVNEGDGLMINVWGEPQVSGEVTVRKDGKFTMALIKEVDAIDRTLDQITQDVVTRLRKFIPTANVSISVSRAAPVTYYLSGSFLKPGPYMSPTNVTLLQAISTGNGFAPFADESNITLIRQTKDGEVRYKLDYNRVLNGSEPNPILKNGDVVDVR